MSDEVLYVSWGGAGRPASLRMAMQRAADADRALVYLAILNSSSFADLDDIMFDLVTDELRWLLEAQLELARRQTGLLELETRVVVQRGDIVDEVRSVVEAAGIDEVFVGAPLIGHDGRDPEALLAALCAGTGVAVELLTPSS